MSIARPRCDDDGDQAVRQWLVRTDARAWSLAARGEARSGHAQPRAVGAPLGTVALVCAEETVGRIKAKHAPPCGGLATSSRPSCASAILRTIVSPRPNRPGRPGCPWRQ